MRRTSLIVFLAALAAGLILRLHEISAQVVWHDEVVTLLRVAGHSRQEVAEALVNSRVVTSRDAVLRYQELPPGGTLRAELAQITRSSLTAPNLPAYYLVARLWAEFFSLSPVSLRLLSAALGIGAIALLMLLCARHLGGTELSRYAGAAALVSPYFVGYGREARSYSLLLLILAATTLLFFEHRRSPKLHTLVALLCVLLHLGAFTWSVSGKLRGQLLGCALLAVAAASPWFSALLKAPEMLHHFTADNPPESYSRGLLRTVSRLIVEPQSPVIPSNLEYFTAAAAAALFIFAAANCVRGASSARTALILWLPVPAALVAMDLILGGQRALFLRYLFPAALAETVAIGALMARGGRITAALTAFLAGSAFTIFSAQSDPAWNRTPSIVKDTLPVAAALDRHADLPLLSAIPPLKLLSIANHLGSNRAIIQAGPKTTFDRIPAETGAPFLVLTEADDHWTERAGPARCSEEFYRGKALVLRRCELQR